MSMTNVENTIRNNILSNTPMGILKFVDIGKGSGKLNHGVLQAEKLDKFMQAMTEATTFLDNIKMVTSDNDKMVLDTMSFDLELEAGRIRGEPQTLSNYQDPNVLDRAFNAEELRALTGIHRTALRQNIERKGFMNTLASTFGAACGRALERVLIYGNTNSTQENVSTGYKVIDGIAQKISAEGDIENEEIDLTGTDTNIVTELRRMIDAFPNKYIEDGNMKFFVPEIVKRTLIRYIADSKTSDISVNYLKDKNQISIEGIPLISVPAFSNPRNGFDKPVILTHAENIQYLINTEKVIVEDAFELKSNKWDIASTVYADINFAFADASSIGFLKETSEPSNVPTRKVNVRVTDTKRNPISGVEVTLTSTSKTGEPALTGITGSAGGCTISKVPYGEYTIKCPQDDCENYDEYDGSADPYTVDGNSKTLHIRLKKKTDNA